MGSFLKYAKWRVRHSVKGLPHLLREHSKRGRTLLRKRLVLLALASMVAAGSGLAAVKWVGMPAYREWKRDRLLAQAARMVEDEDYRGAILTVHQVLRGDYNNLAANLKMAEIGEAIVTGEALFYRQRLTLLDPDNESFHRERVRLALQWGRISEAEQALEETPEKFRNDSAYRWAVYELAALVGDRERKESALNDILAANPADERGRLLLNSLRLTRGASGAGEIRRTLATLPEDDPDRVFIQRQLMARELQRGRGDLALAMGMDLWEEPLATIEDRFDLLELARSAGAGPVFATWRRELETGPALDSPGLASRWGRQLTRMEMADAALDWLSALPPEYQETPDVREALAVAAMEAGRWNDLEQLTASGNWDRADHRRHALRARALTELGREAQATDEWRLATAVADQRPSFRRDLIGLAQAWEWHGRAAPLIDRALRESPGEEWLNPVILLRVRAEGNSRPMAKLLELRRAAAEGPENLLLASDHARVLLLLGEDEERAREMALRAKEAHPRNPLAVATHGLALYQQFQTAEAAALFEEFSPEEIEGHPGAAFYAALFHAETGQADKARDLLRIARPGLILLPEEEVLFRIAEEHISRAERLGSLAP